MDPRHEALATGVGPDIARVIETYMDQMLAIDIKRYKTLQRRVLWHLRKIIWAVRNTAKHEIVTLIANQYSEEFYGQIPWDAFILELNPCVRTSGDGEMICQGIYTSSKLWPPLSLMGFPDFWKLYKFVKANPHDNTYWVEDTYINVGPKFDNVREKAEAIYRTNVALRQWCRPRKK